MNDYYKYIDEKVNEFIVAIREELDNTVQFKYSFSEEEKLFRIQHNNVNFNDIEFKKMMGKNLKMIFFENNIN